jgi:deoxyribodipyrimidine photo-lyase
MRDNALAARRLGLNYWPYVETPSQPAAGLLRRLAARAALVVSDDFPAFVVPGQSRALARQVDVPFLAVDANGVVPLALLGPPVAAAAHLRTRLHKLFAAAWPHRAARRPRLTDAVCKPVAAPFATFEPGGGDSLLAQLPLDASVPAVEGSSGGSVAAGRRLRAFVGSRLAGYADTRSHPASPEAGHASGLSAYLHFGHISIEQVVEDVLARSGDWSLERLRPERCGKREGFFGVEADADAFLDEALTWRDLGFHWHRHRGADTVSLERALPVWAMATLTAHAGDRRAYVYPPEAWEAGATHDPLWNAAQRELVATGTVHNYLRMLWGKKVIEWSRTPHEAYRTLVHLNNKYALDGRDPNSWTGILWCFGAFDRPWAPQRPVLGSVRYMSSENTARKFRLGPYLEYVSGLPSIADVRGAAAMAGAPVDEAGRSA